MRNLFNPSCCCSGECPFYYEDVSGIDDTNHPSGWTVSGVTAGQWSSGATATVPGSYLGSLEAFSLQSGIKTGSFTLTVQGKDVVVDAEAGTVTLDGNASIFKPRGTDERIDVFIVVTPGWMGVYIYWANTEFAYRNRYRGSIQILDGTFNGDTELTIESNAVGGELQGIVGRSHTRTFVEGELESFCPAFPRVPACTEIQYQEGVHSVQGISYWINLDQSYEYGGCSAIDHDEFYSPARLRHRPSTPGPAGEVDSIACGIEDRNATRRGVYQYYINVVNYSVVATPDNGVIVAASVQQWYFDQPTSVTPYPKPRRRASLSLVNTDRRDGAFDLNPFTKSAGEEFFADFDANGRAPGTLIVAVDDNIDELCDDGWADSFWEGEPLVHPSIFRMREVQMQWDIE